jgi:hypothetical protein
MTKLKSIAIHLPQFHPIPENDVWWGKGFTEWTNVTKATPRFEGHYQPHLPADLGFYDLRLEEARLAQEQLAKEYGIHGFCYYHYWFNGKRILEQPVAKKLQNPKEDLPFMLCWANENWTRRWDGGNDTILLKQDYSEEDDINHIQHLIPYFQDPRYIRINNRPVFCIYRSTLFPNMEHTITTWRNECKKHNIDLYLCRFETFSSYGKSYMDTGFDAGIEFQPKSDMMDQFIQHQYQKATKKISYRLQYRWNKWTGNLSKNQKMKDQFQYLIDYNDYVDFLIAHYQYDKDYVYYPCITPSWDNSARNKINPFIFLNANPEKYKEWLAFHTKNFKPSREEENFIFVNAWNEWAEGNHLEPCQKWGRAYLQAHLDVMSSE